MCSVRVRKFTGLMRKYIFPFSSVVENQNFPALFDSLCNLRMQLPGLRLSQVRTTIANADCRHRRFTSSFELRMLRYQPVKVFCLAYVVVDPFPDLACPITLETHPHLKAAKAPRLLEAVT